MQPLRDLIERHKAGEPVGVYAVCSAHPLVLKAALKQGVDDNSLVLIEATSNQVNQDGGYTGLTPADFHQLVYSLASDIGLPREKLLLGGDHLGPNCWQHLPADEAMAKSETLIAAYVEAGFRKIHLDCSMSCAGDPIPLGENIVAHRAARLCQIAEQTWQRVGGEAPLYIIGTEVPVPGGAHELEEELAVTEAGDAAQTLDMHQTAFAALGLDAVWDRVIGLVVQPGVEFDHHKIIHYAADKATVLSRFIETVPGKVFEAHSTDYQADTAYCELVRDHFAILKVGPALTFAMREALFALDSVEREWLGEHRASHLRETVEQVMRQEPDYWHRYYSNTGHQRYLDCQYSFSDRIRYYWSHPVVDSALKTMMQNLTELPPPGTLLSQYLPNQYRAVVRGEIGSDPEALIIDKVMEVTRIYSRACGCVTEEK